MPPQELTDIIIDYLHNDEAALRSASLVCKSWFPESRFQLFSSIKLPVYDVYNASGLIEAICAEGSTIPPYILHLEIENKGHQDAKNVDLALLRLPPFNNLKSLSLGQIKWASLTDAKKCVISMAQNITTLSLCYFTVRHFRLLSSLFCLICYSLKPLMKLLPSLRPPHVWRILSSGRSNVMMMMIEVVCAIILRRHMHRP